MNMSMKKIYVMSFLLINSLSLTCSEITEEQKAIEEQFVNAMFYPTPENIEFMKSCLKNEKKIHESSAERDNEVFSLLNGWVILDGKCNLSEEVIKIKQRSRLAKIMPPVGMIGHGYGYGNVLWIASSMNDIELADLAISCKAQIEAEILMSAPLLIAAKNNHLEMCKFLLAKGAKVSIYSENNYDCFHNNPLRKAIENDSLEMVKLFMNAGLTKAGTEDVSLLFTAVEQKAKKVAQYFMAQGQDINAKDKFGNTILHRAANRYEEDVIKVALDLDADGSILNNDGRTYEEVRESALASDGRLYGSWAGRN